MSELERFWSPEPVIAYKFYPRHFITNKLVGCNQPIEPNKLYGANCSVRERQELSLSSIGWVCMHCWKPISIRCEGDGIPFNEHRWQCGCNNNDSASVPSCGFYAYRLDNDSDRMMQSIVSHTHRFLGYRGINNTEIALVRVELHGTVLEHGYGYKASKLKIAEIGDERSDCAIPIVRNLRSGWLIESWMKIIKEWRERYYA